jgi:hypothetical protein
LLEDVDWQGLFSSFFENMRMKIKCRDSSKILKERLFCIDKKLYKIAITVEVPKESGGFHGSSKGGGGVDDDKGGDKDNFDDVDDLEEDDTHNDGMNFDKRITNHKTNKAQALETSHMGNN